MGEWYDNANHCRKIGDINYRDRKNNDKLLERIEKIQNQNELYAQEFHLLREQVYYLNTNVKNVLAIKLSPLKIISQRSLLRINRSGLPMRLVYESYEKDGADYIKKLPYPIHLLNIV